ncbi:WW domain-binding protein 11 [Scaptodrosophila lebanonensis]|uniref:WW domain-binding protein 11 n=1 Tax=Drosophila lebanonensis TaxID=7225 RepID=A0A6J2TPA8_DROLE|nr:WW domain-binding protein 11 [Scaptodrosophila lebanonensis]
MGRRSINTTKSGKYMNPTDQARKEARKKELKKNKRQRQMVRAAVLKNKDPAQILEEMEKIDEMEYNVLQPSPLNEKVLRDKRKKLKETFDRVMRLYHNDEPEHWAELKRKEVDYEKKRLKKQQYYESVKHAQSVQVDEIPLPAPVSTTASVGPGTSGGGGVIFTGGIRAPPPPMTLALPPFAPGAPPGVVKNSADSSEPLTDKAKDDEDKDWLGVPPGPPPDLFAMTELDSDAEGNTDYDEENDTERSPKRRSPSRTEPSQLQQRMLAMSGQNIDDFMKEMEHVHKRKHRKLQDDADNKDLAHEEHAPADSMDNERKTAAKSPADTSSDDDDNDDDDDDEDDDDDMDDSDTESRVKLNKQPIPYSSKELPKNTAPSISPSPTASGKTTTTPPMAPSLPAIPLPPTPVATIGNTPIPTTVPAPPQMPLPSSALSHLSHGLTPPPGLMFRPPPMRGPAPGLPGFGMRMPPGPPPGPRPPHALGMPRMGIRMPPGPPPGLPPRMAHHLKHGHPNGPTPKEPGKGVTTITAKPQIRNLSADVTRFVPSTLRVKREDQRRPHARPKHLADAHERAAHAPQDAHKPPTKDDAYLQFMNEMQGLL